MFQEPLLLRGTVAHNAGLGLALRGVGRAERELVLHQLKIAHLADRPERTPAPASPSFPISVDGAIPPEIWLNSLPSEAEELAPQLRGLVMLRAGCHRRSAHPQGGNRISEMGEAVSCMTANPEGGRKRLLQPDVFRLASQRAAGRPDMHLRRVISMMRETRCSQVERTHDQVEQ